MNMSEPCLALAPVFGLIADCVAHVGFSWLWQGHRRLAGLGAAFVVGLILTMATSALVLGNQEITEALAILLFNAASYAALAYGYYNFVGLNFSSLRIRLLQELLHAGDGMPRSELERRYGTAEIVTRRLDRLQGSGQLIERDGRFYLGKRLLLIVARLNDGVRWLVLGTTVAPGQTRAAERPASESWSVGFRREEPAKAGTPTK